MPDTMQRVRFVQRNRTLKLCYIFTSNDTCNLDVVGKLLSCIKEKLGIKMLAFKNHFSLSDTTEMCESIIPDLPMDFAIFEVHANEDQFLINEGSARIYRALLKATGGKVLVVICGDDNYKDSFEQQGSFLSRWARRKISSQFSEECLDGTKSFIFSWDREHRPIHEEALLHYFDPDKKDKKFVPEREVEVPVTPLFPKQEVECRERREIGVKRSGTEAEKNVSNKISAGAQRDQGVLEQFLQDSPQTEDARAPLSMELVPDPGEKKEEDEPMDESNEPFEDFEKISYAYIPGMDTSPPQESIAILMREESDINMIKEVFGDAVLQSINRVTSRDPCSMKDFLLSQITPVRSCFVIVESTKIKEEFLTNSSRTVYLELLKTAIRIVEKKIVVILCSEGKSLTPSEEENITATIKELLGEKGVVIWCKGNNKTKRSSFSRSYPPPEHPKNPEELVFKTRLLRGKISYDEKDVKVRVKGWAAPQKMAEDLLRNWRTTNSAELSVYRERKTGNERTVVTQDFESRMSAISGNIGSRLISVGASAFGAITQVGSNLISGSEATGVDVGFTG